MAYYKIDPKDNKTIIIEHPEGVFNAISGDYRDSTFFPHPESLAKSNIDEEVLFNYLRGNPRSTSIRMAKDKDL